MDSTVQHKNWKHRQKLHIGSFAGKTNELYHTCYLWNIVSLIVFVRVRTAAKLAGKQCFVVKPLASQINLVPVEHLKELLGVANLQHEQTTRIVNLFFLSQSPADTASIGSLGGSRHHRTNCSHLLQRRCLKLSNAQSSVCTTWWCLSLSSFHPAMRPTLGLSQSCDTACVSRNHSNLRQTPARGHTLADDISVRVKRTSSFAAGKCMQSVDDARNDCQSFFLFPSNAS